MQEGLTLWERAVWEEVWCRTVFKTQIEVMFCRLAFVSNKDNNFIAIFLTPLNRLIALIGKSKFYLQEAKTKGEHLGKFLFPIPWVSRLSPHPYSSGKEHGFTYLVGEFGRRDWTQMALPLLGL